MGSFYEGMRVVVFGGAGMIGSQLCGLLLRAGASRVVAVDDLSRGRLSNLNGLDVDFVRMDVTSGMIKEWLYGSDCVFNLTAKVTGMHYNRDHHAEMFYHNMLAQIKPLMFSVEIGVKRYLECSTVCVYPREMSFPVTEEEGHVGEPEPTNAGYGWAKRMGECFAEWVGTEYNIDVAITRFSNCFGPRDYWDPETSHVIPALISRILGNDEVVKVYGTGNQVREFLYSRDAALGAMKVMEYGVGRGPINIGNPRNRITIRGLAKLIQEAAGVSKPLSFDTSIPDGYPRRGSDITKLIALTGWQPETGLLEGLRKTIRWYAEHREIAGD